MTASRKGPGQGLFSSECALTKEQISQRLAIVFAARLNRAEARRVHSTRTLVLRTLDAAPREVQHALTAHEICRIIERSRPCVCDVLRTCIEQGIVERLPGNRYRKKASK